MKAGVRANFCVFLAAMVDMVRKSYANILSAGQGRHRTSGACITLLDVLFTI